MRTGSRRSGGSPLRVLAQERCGRAGCGRGGRGPRRRRRSARRWKNGSRTESSRRRVERENSDAASRAPGSGDPASRRRSEAPEPGGAGGRGRRTEGQRPEPSGHRDGAAGRGGGTEPRGAARGCSFRTSKCGGQFCGPGRLASGAAGLARRRTGPRNVQVGCAGRAASTRRWRGRAQATALRVRRGGCRKKKKGRARAGGEPRTARWRREA